MSLQFSDTDAYKGLAQEYEREIGADYGDVTNSPRRLKAFAVSVNMALDDYYGIAHKSDGTWKFDDTNNEDFPEITTDLLSTTNTYAFLTDNNGSQIYDIFRVYAKDPTTGIYKLLEPVDPDSQQDLADFYDGATHTGMPTKYDKKANAIVVNSRVASTVTDGLKVSINREMSYFVYTDTVKKPGVPGIHHKYFFLRPAEDYARRKGLKNLKAIQEALMVMEGKDRDGAGGTIAKYYARRTKDEKPRLSMNIESCE